MTRDEFIQKIAKGMDLPIPLLERLTQPRPPGDTQDGGWRLARMPSMDEVEEFHLESRFASSGWRTSIKEVVDGQQRVRCVIGYKNDKFSAKHPNHERPLLYSQLSKRERIHFLQSALSVGYLVGATDADVIEIFARINTVAKTLNPQEKRNANYSGEFKQFCLSEAVERLPFWRKNGIFTDNQISRMAEVQFVSDLVMNLIGGLQDFSPKKIDSFYGKYDNDFSYSSKIKKNLDRIYSILLDMPDDLIKGSIFSVSQLLFSLILVLNSRVELQTSMVRDCIVDLDARVEAVRSGENSQALSTEVYDAFTSGNLHRIRSREIRDKEIKTYFK